MPQNHATKRIEYRRWRQFDFDSFCEDLRKSSLVRDLDRAMSIADDEVDKLFECYDATLSSLLDIHAQVQTISIRVDRSARWYDADCKIEKRTTRRLEKIYRRTKFPDDLLL